MNYWLKPLMIVLAIFAFIVLLVEALPATFPDVSWSAINPTVITVLPWLTALGVVIAVLGYILWRD